MRDYIATVSVYEEMFGEPIAYLYVHNTANDIKEVVFTVFAHYDEKTETEYYYNAVIPERIWKNQETFHPRTIFKQSIYNFFSKHTPSDKKSNYYPSEDLEKLDVLPDADCDVYPFDHDAIKKYMEDDLEMSDQEILVIQMPTDQPLRQTDILGRDRIGYREGMSQEEIYQAARGFWRLKPQRALDVNAVLIVFKDEIVQELELTGLHRADATKFYITGNIVEDSRFVGRKIRVNQSNNRIKYFDAGEVAFRTR